MSTVILIVVTTGLTTLCLVGVTLGPRHTTFPPHGSDDPR